MSVSAKAETFVGPPVRLAIFQGPLDLLAYLVRLHQVEIQDIPVSEVVEQFVAFVRTMEVLHIDTAAAFLPVAAALVLWKARSLLPRDEDEEEQEEPEEEVVVAELVRATQAKLAEYQAYRAAAARLQQAHALCQQIFLRSHDEEEIASGWVTLEGVEIFDMVLALGRVLERTKSARSLRLPRPQWTVRGQMGHVVARLRSAAGQLSFTALFDDAPDRLWVVVTFLAILELVRRGRVRLETSARRELTLRLHS
jgi:segregation and condensation protein A